MAPVADVQELVIQQVGRFAVLVYSLAHHTDLAYVGVARGETEAAAGGAGGTIPAGRRRHQARRERRAVRVPGVGRARLPPRHVEAPQVQEDTVALKYVRCTHDPIDRTTCQTQILNTYNPLRPHYTSISVNSSLDEPKLNCTSS